MKGGTFFIQIEIPAWDSANPLKIFIFESPYLTQTL